MLHENAIVIYTEYFYGCHCVMVNKPLVQFFLHGVISLPEVMSYDKCQYLRKKKTPLFLEPRDPYMK